jgi:hypothetical protein
MKSADGTTFDKLYKKTSRGICISEKPMYIITPSAKERLLMKIPW